MVVAVLEDGDDFVLLVGYAADGFGGPGMGLADDALHFFLAVLQEDVGDVFAVGREVDDAGMGAEELAEGVGHLAAGIVAVAADDDAVYSGEPVHKGGKVFAGFAAGSGGHADEVAVAGFVEGEAVFLAFGDDELGHALAGKVFGGEGVDEAGGDAELGVAGHLVPVFAVGAGLVGLHRGGVGAGAVFEADELAVDGEGVDERGQGDGL